MLGAAIEEIEVDCPVAVDFTSLKCLVDESCLEGGIGGIFSKLHHLLGAECSQGVEVRVRDSILPNGHIGFLIGEDGV